MDRAATNSLARFCADQYFGFDPEDWIVRSLRSDRASVIAAARYLSQTSWYGRENDLARIAATLEAAPAGGAGAAQAARAHDFNLGLFAAVLRLDIMSRRLSAGGSTGDGRPGMRAGH
ncbi:MAG: hypothetical protein JSS40_04175 [Proteobacteria bacterium]|nr:hypothetical protein [Pseudomonadota bacterium]